MNPGGFPSGEGYRWGNKMIEPNRIKWWDVLRDTAIVWAITFFGGLVVGVVLLLPAFQGQRVVLAAKANMITAPLAFTLIGCLGRRAKPDRLLHLGLAGVGIWLIGFTNVFIFPWATVIAWITSAVPIAVYVVVGGGLSLLFAPPRSVMQIDEEDHTMPQQKVGQVSSDAAPSAAPDEPAT